MPRFKPDRPRPGDGDGPQARLAGEVFRNPPACLSRIGGEEIRPGAGGDRQGRRGPLGRAGRRPDGADLLRLGEAQPALGADGPLHGDSGPLPGPFCSYKPSVDMALWNEKAITWAICAAAAANPAAGAFSDRGARSQGEPHA